MNELTTTLIVILLFIIAWVLTVIAIRIKQFKDELMEAYWETHYAYEQEQKKKIFEMLLRHLQKNDPY